MKKLFLPVALLAMGSMQSYASAADTADASTLADSMSVVLNQVDVVANRAGSKTPMAFTNVAKGQLLKNNDGRDMTYLLQMTPSVVTTSDAGAGMGYTSMRVRGTDGSRINVTANGIPINNPESHNVYWVNMPDLASSLRDVQIQRGAGTSANGAGAFGASVNMVTDAPSDEAYAELSGAYGMYNTNRETLRVGSGLLGNHWSFDARISHLGSNGYIERASSELWSYFGQAAFQSYNTSVRLLAFGGKEKTYMAWDYATKEEMEEYGRRYNPCGEYTDNAGQRAYYPDQYDNYVQHHFQLLLSQRLGNYFHLNAALHYTKDDGYYDQYKAWKSLADYGLEPYYDAAGNKFKKADIIRLKNNDNHFGGGQLTLNYRRDRWDVTLGGAVTDFKGHHFGQVKWVRNYIGALDPLQPYYDNYGRKFDSNVYLRANYNITKELTAFADMQYRHIHYTIDGESDNYVWSDDAEKMVPDMLAVNRRWNFFNPKLGLNFVKGDHRAFASWSVAHKEPTRDNFTDGDSSVPPQAERLNDFELGYTFTRPIFSLGVNLYYMLYKDQLVATGQLTDTGNAMTVNTPDSYRMGVEFQGALRPCQWFDWNLNFTLSRNRIKNFTEYIYEEGWTNPMLFERGDTPISFSPGFIFNNAFNFHVAGFDASIDTRYVGKQYMNNARSEAAALDAYCVTDLHLGYTLKNVMGVKEARIGFSIYNLFNHKYFNNGYVWSEYNYTDASRTEYVIDYHCGYAASAPTNVMGTLTLKF